MLEVQVEDPKESKPCWYRKRSKTKPLPSVDIESPALAALEGIKDVKVLGHRGVSVGSLALERTLAVSVSLPPDTGYRKAQNESLHLSHSLQTLVIGRRRMNPSICLTPSRHCRHSLDSLEDTRHNRWILIRSTEENKTSRKYRWLVVRSGEYLPHPSQDSEPAERIGNPMTALRVATRDTRVLAKLPSKDGVLFQTSGIGEPSVYHALVVIFLEFFAWGLLTMPIIAVLNETFPDHTFLMNGLIMGIKGLLSFLSAPLIGALSDVWGRKFFLLITVFFTCAPIPLMTINTWWFFAMISISGVFAVTFSVVFAYVADVTEEHERSLAYGLVSATFAASMVISPALGAYMMDAYSENLVVALATAIAILDVFFILVAVPESLPEKVRPSSWGAPISWEQADPFAVSISRESWFRYRSVCYCSPRCATGVMVVLQALRKVGKDHTILMLCVTVFLSYLPEAGQYSCIFVYLKLVSAQHHASCLGSRVQIVMGFSVVMVAVFIATVGILSVGAQIVLGLLMRSLGSKHTIMLGLVFEMLQLMWYGFGSQTWMMWAAGVLASVSSITYPAISAFVSMHSDADKQGLVQGMVTGMRGLCNGLGPAMFGLIFYLFHVDLNEDSTKLRESRGPASSVHGDNNTAGQIFESMQPSDLKRICCENHVTPSLVTWVVQSLTCDCVWCVVGCDQTHTHTVDIGNHNSTGELLVPGPPFVFGAFLVICALLVAVFIPDGAPSMGSSLRPTSSRRQSGLSMEVHYEVERSKKHDGISPLSPLVDNSAVL
uniref:Major facilitator superfamily (MFS) profile domain-containing protein n=1 Tax=Timema shepardi TaxID=629360 RepID=A0A7R9B377_TIMSH|nr:unnamed protein product [Timema shepardi]